MNLRHALHRLAHRFGWNRCIAVNDGYQCDGCGRFTPWR